MEQNISNTENFDLSGWFKVGGDIDDFIFYSETVHPSEK